MSDFSKYVFAQLVGAGGGVPPFISVGLFDPTLDAQTIASGAGIVGSFIFNGTNFDRNRSLPDDADAQAVGTLGLAGSVNRNYLFNGATWDREYAMTLFNTANASAAGDQAGWTPNTGFRFRLMGYVIEITGDATLAAGAVLAVQLLDNATTIVIHRAFVPTAAPTNPAGLCYSTGFVSMGNGYLSTTTDNVLNVNLSAALTAGSVNVQLFGTEQV